MTAGNIEPQTAIKTGTLGRIGWVLFEWGRNPYVLIITVYVYATYFSRTIVGDPVEGQALWAGIQGYAGLIVAASAPILGAIADAGGPRKPWIAVFACVLALSTALLWFGMPGGAGLGLTGIAVVIALCSLAYDGSLVFHSAMLPALVPQARIGRWSGLGYALGNLAGILLLLFILIFIYIPAVPAFGLSRAAHEHERISGPIIAIWFAVFSLPFFLFTPDRPSKNLPLRTAIREGIGSVVRTVRSLRDYRNVGTFLFARMIYNDGLNVMLSFGGVYAAGVFSWGEDETALYGIVLSAFAAAGGFLGGQIGDRIGTKTALILSISGTILAASVSLGFRPDRLFFVFPYPKGEAVLPIPYFNTAPELCFIGAIACVATCLVATYANSRTMMARIAPESRMTEFFGLYALSGEATAFAAPIAVAVVTAATGSQQWGMGAIIAFLALGLLGLLFVREERARAV